MLQENIAVPVVHLQGFFSLRRAAFIIVVVLVVVLAVGMQFFGGTPFRG